MRYLFLMGSPRKKGNTIQVVTPLMEALGAAGIETELIWLYDKQIAPCTACRVCQKDWTSFSCRVHDDMYEIADKIMAADCIVFATPIYSWYCTAPMKAMLDRLVYGLNKYYGEKWGPSLWTGKNAAVAVTCGYPVDKGAIVFEDGMKRYCKHSKLNLVGTLAIQATGVEINNPFLTEEKMREIGSFAQTLVKAGKQQ